MESKLTSKILLKMISKSLLNKFLVKTYGVINLFTYGVTTNCNKYGM